MTKIVELYSSRPKSPTEGHFDGRLVTTAASKRMAPARQTPKYSAAKCQEMNKELLL
jgi:hypothetical protein